MALARINEINKQMQSAQQPQPPAEPLNQSLPKQAMQNMGIGALGQGQPAPQMQAPQQAPQQAAPQQAPQMPPQGMAEGGLAGLPVDPRMFEYGSGGVVAFQVGGDVDEEAEEDDAEEGDVGADEGARVSYDAVAELRKLQPQIAAQMKQGVRPVRSRAEIEKALTKDYGVDTGPVGTKYLEGLASLKEAKAADRTQQDAEIAQREKMAAARALADWSEGSRGQKGLGGLNAFTRSYTTSAEKLMGERADLRQSGIKVDELLNEAQYKVQALRQAQRDGDIKAEQKADIDLAKIAKDLGVSKNTLIGRAVTGNLGVIGKQVMADAQIQSARERAKGKGAGAGAKKPTDLGSSYEVELAALLEAGEPNDALTRKKAMNAAQAQLSKSAGTERNRITSVKEANTEFANRILMDREARKLRTKPDEYKARAEAIRREVETEFGIKPDAAVPAAPAPVSAPAAASSTPPVSKLKEGVATKFENGQTWTLKNGKPEQVS
jgi:hypothetical protein